MCKLEDQKPKNVFASYRIIPNKRIAGYILSYTIFQKLYILSPFRSNITKKK